MYSQYPLSKQKVHFILLLPFVLAACDSENYNAPPEIDAGPNQYVQAGEEVNLVASVIDDGSYTLTWTQTSGPEAELVSDGANAASFFAPEVQNTQVAVFTATVDDAKNDPVSDEVQVFINPSFGNKLELDWNELGLELVKKSERGPTISGRFMAYLNTALYSAWAAYSEKSDPWLSSVKNSEQFDSSNSLSTAQYLTMSASAYNMFVDFASGDSSILNQAQLEIGTGEDAEIIRAEMLELADELLTNSKTLAESRLNPSVADDVLISAEGLASSISGEILTFAMTDGSQPLNNYSDSTAPYVPQPWAAPAPTREQRNKINFYNENAYVDDDGVQFPVYVFEDFDPRVAARAVGAEWDAEGRLLLESPTTKTYNPAVLSGEVKLTSTWQSLTEWGIFPPADDGGTQVPLTSHWGEVATFAISSGAALRPEFIKTPYLDGDLNMEFVEEARQVVDFAELMEDRATGGASQRAQSEYWELGDATAYPPGWWTEIATDLARRNELSALETLRLMMAVSQAVFDAGVAAWDSKYYFNSVRPYTVINQLFLGSQLPSFRGDVVAGADDRNVWFPYQLRRNFTPPFPDVPSGHSAFSYAASTVISKVLQSNFFDYRSENFISRFDLNDGFDGDTENGNEETNLYWEFLSLAAEEAGMSRLYGGIHMMEGNWIGLQMGVRTGHAALSKVDALIDGTASAINDDNEWLSQAPELLFGTMKADDLEVVPAEGALSEVYGFYGNDVLRVSDTSAGHVSLLGGDGVDTFVIAGDSDIQIRDYQRDELIIIGSGPWGSISLEELSAEAAGNMTQVTAANSSLIVKLDGIWSIAELNLQTE